ncbi:hypothetical protein IAT40_006028 [Kwoniella sp. CBS 6097]
MRIVRLSRASPIPPDAGPLKTPLSAPPHQPPQPISSQTLNLLTTILLPPLLGLALTLTLLPLLLPTVNHTSLSFFSVEPIGHAREVGVVALNGSTGYKETAMMEDQREEKREMENRQSDVVGHVEYAVDELHQDRNETEDHDDDDGKGGTVENGSTLEWLGKDGPRIYVGALQICSKNQSHPKVYCTSSSQTGSHTGSLPFSLAQSLMTLPTSPRTPILLLVSAILSVIATFIFSAGLIPWTCSPTINFLGRKPPLKPDPHSTYPDAEHIIDLEAASTSKLPGSPSGQGQGQGDKRPLMVKGRPHGAFFCLIVAALGLACGALIELKDVHEVRSYWDEEDARAVGLVFKLGALTYILPFLPLSLIVILLVAASSTIHNLFSSFFHRCPADQEFPLVSAGPVIKISPPADGPVGNGWAEIPIANTAPGGMIVSKKDADEDEGEERRNTFGGVKANK